MAAEQRVMDMLEKKRKGGRIRKAPVRRKQASSDLAAALESSLKTVRKRA
jgi:non-homologous end joining protein Ku